MRRKNRAKPAVILTTLEDSAPWLDQRLVSAYLRTTYRVLEPAFDLRIGQPHPAFEAWLEEHQATGYAFLTAWNPGSQRSPTVGRPQGSPQPSDNETRNRALETELRQLVDLVLPGLGIGDAGDWEPEQSFCAIGLAPERAIALGRAFGQNALVFGERGGMPQLWWLPARPE